MDRRKFIKTSALAGVAGATALSTASCSSLKFLPTGLPVDNQPDMDAYLAMMDEGMHRISQWNPVDEFTGTASETSDRAKANHVARNAYKSLYVTAMFSDLSPDDQLHPGMQSRIKKALPQMDLATSEMEKFMQGENAVSADVLQDFLNQDDDPGMRFLEQFNGQAQQSGITGSRRAQTRAMTTRMLWRLKNQAPELVIDEYQTKMKKLETNQGNDAAVSHLIATKVSEQAFWKWQQQQSSGDVTQEAVPAVYNSWTQSDFEEIGGVSKKEVPEDDKENMSSRGAKKMGIGMAIFAGGTIILAAGAFPGVFIMTVGAIFFLIGLIQLMVGAVSDKDPDPQTV